jgi:hypothetical protein
MDRASVLVWSTRMFGSLYQVRLTGKRFKAWNKYVYHTAKYTVAVHCERFALAHTPP